MLAALEVHRKRMTRICRIDADQRGMEQDTQDEQDGDRRGPVADGFFSSGTRRGWGDRGGGRHFLPALSRAGGGGVGAGGGGARVWGPLGALRSLPPLAGGAGGGGARGGPAGARALRGPAGVRGAVGGVPG